MRKLSAAAVALLLAGCASAPKPQVIAAPAPIVKAEPKPTVKSAPAVEQPTPNQTVKKRWQWPHPKWFH